MPSWNLLCGTCSASISFPTVSRSDPPDPVLVSVCALLLHFPYPAFLPKRPKHHTTCDFTTSLAPLSFWPSSCSVQLTLVPRDYQACSSWNVEPICYSNLWRLCSPGALPTSMSMQTGVSLLPPAPWVCQSTQQTPSAPVFSHISEESA